MYDTARPKNMSIAITDRPEVDKEDPELDLFSLEDEAGVPELAGAPDLEPPVIEAAEIEPEVAALEVVAVPLDAIELELDGAAAAAAPSKAGELQDRIVRIPRFMVSQRS